MSHPTSLAALAALLTGSDARASVMARDGGPYIEMLVARIAVEGLAVDVEMEAVSAPGGPISLHDVSLRRESAAHLAAVGLIADPSEADTPEEQGRARIELHRFAMELVVAHADALRGQLAQTPLDA